MVIALFSDVHANLPALQACLRDIDRKSPDAIYCLGDLVGYNVWPNEAIVEVRAKRIPTIAGNYDFGIGRKVDDCGCAYKMPEERALDKLSIFYTNTVLGDDERNYLRALPAQIRIEYELNDGKLKMLLVHGSPRKINEYLFEHREEKSILRILKGADTDILCIGHTHMPYHRIIGHDGRFFHVINTGSVGMPMDRDPRGCYVLLTINSYSTAAIRNSIHVQFVRFEYDIEMVAAAIENSGLPGRYADIIRTGRCT